MTKFAVLGGGKIAEALISGLVASGVDGGDMVVTNRRSERSQELEKNYGVNTTSDNSEAVAGADVVVVSVKPYAVVEVLEEVADSLAEGAVVISLAAGITLEAMEKVVPDTVGVARVMPNTPMLVGKGVSSVTAGTNLTEEQLEQVKDIMGSVGIAVEIAEKDMGAISALSGSAPAYYYLVTEALIDAGVQLGLPRDVASRLAMHTAEGAGVMMAQEGADAAVLRQNVTSPGGTTAAAIRELEESGLRGAFYRAAQACAERADELGK